MPIRASGTNTVDIMATGQICAARLPTLIPTIT
jgi:hypothetical protein